jgi:hypothetical protein
MNDKSQFEVVCGMSGFAPILLPKYTWSWKLHGDSCTQFSDTSAPCWFHRQMQRLILGIHWRKL